MSFVTIEFLLFLAILLLLYYLLPKKLQWGLLLVGSLCFYAFSGWKNLIFILVTAFSTYGSALLIERIFLRQDAYLKEHKQELSREEKKAYKKKNEGRARGLLILCLIFNLGILGVIKYTDFIIGNINGIFGTKIGFMEFLLPLGISFYMFQSLGYVIDVYRRKYPAEKNAGKALLFTSFFPQLIQGPISRYDDLSQTLYGEHKFDSSEFFYGFLRVMWGFLKKLVIADRLAPAIVTLTQNTDRYTGAYVMVAIIFYAVQLYGDFTGGIDITIGVARMFGIQVAENFDRPYFSKNVAEYWRRWHITMGTWFKDYIFYPLSVSGWMLKLSKWSRKHLGTAIGKRIPVYLATMIVWFATGVWHGAAWNFIVWGMLNCLVLLVSQEFDPLYQRFHKRVSFSNTKLYDGFQILRTFLLMGMIRILDVYRDVPLTFRMVGSLFTTPNWGELSRDSFLGLGLTGWDYLVVIMGAVLMFVVSLIRGKGDARTILSGKPPVLRYGILWALILIVVVFGAYGIGFDASKFIYNQF